MPPLFGSTGLLGKQLGSIASLGSFRAPRFDEELTGSLLSPDQPQFGSIAKLSGKSLAFGEQDPLTGSFGRPTKLRGADIGASMGGGATTPRPGMSGSVMGGSGNVGGDWAGVERWANEINAAAAKYGVPVNLIKAIMRVESNGDPNARGASGVWGPMQVHSGVWGYGPWSRDPVANIMKGAEILAHNYQLGNPNNPAEKSWEWAARRYLGLGGPDMYGTDHHAYWQRVSSHWNALNSRGGNAGLGFGGGFGTPSQAIQTMFGGNAGVPDWGEFGVESTNGMYGYGRQYGLNGTQHTGVDIPLPVGSPFFAPMGGTVRCAGTGIGTDAGGGTCGSFGDVFGRGAGRLEIELDNGVVLIFGHTSQSSVRPGQRVEAGTMLGLSGGMVSPHIHLEARVRDNSTPSGWRIVDPRAVLGGSFVVPRGGGTGGGGAWGGQTRTGFDPYTMLQRLRGY